jgi:hypothetical protein
MSTITRRQHYVWRKYLRAWAPNDQIWCLRENNIFNTNLMNIAQERDFYKLRDLTHEEIKFLDDFCNVQREPLRTTNLRWVKYFTATFELQRGLIAKGLPAKEIMRFINEAAIKQEEELHGRIEQDAVVNLDALLAGDASFFKISDEKIKFLYFLCVQYTRTKKLKANALEGPSKLTAVKPENIWNALSHIIATSLAQNLVAYSYQLYFLRPEGEEVFITGDQPVINLHGTYVASTEAPKELDLYYPISPKLAVLVASEPPENSALTDEEVRGYNRHMQLQSHSLLFAHRASVLEPFGETGWEEVKSRNRD